MPIYDTKQEPGPLELAFQQAVVAEDVANDALWADLEVSDPDDEHGPLYLAWKSAMEERCVAQQAFLASGELRSYTYREDGFSTTFWATSDAEAIKHAESMLSNGDYGEITETFWPEACIEGENGESHRVQIIVNPEEPACTNDNEHDWQSPIELVGGIKENPGVWGHGGGVVIHEVCMNCGCGKTTDTWAQDRNTGEQGLRSVSYEPDKFQLPEDE